MADHLLPVLPYPGYSWPLTQHMGVVAPGTLHALAWAAMTYGNEPDPAPRINEYLVANKIFPPNLRKDSQQSDIWRDYQQVLAELGLMFSTQLIRQITLTPLGLSFAQKQLSFDDFMTMQALRYQYPNAQKHAIDPGLKAEISDKPYALVGSRVELMATTGVLIRPGVFTLDLLLRLVEDDLRPSISLNEFEYVVMRAKTHDDIDVCLRALTAIRAANSPLVSADDTRRNASDWFRFLKLTTLFTGSSREELTLTNYALANRGALHKAVFDLSRPESFWLPARFDKQEKFDWFLFFGTEDFYADFPHDEVSETKEVDSPVSSTGVTLSQYSTPKPRKSRPGLVVSAYDVEISDERAAVHDQMCDQIADVARSRGANVEHDPRSADLVIGLADAVYPLECKSVTHSNIVSKLRFAIGQVINYEYWLNRQGRTCAQSLVALTANVPESHWIVDLVREHAHMGLVVLHKGQLKTYSNDDAIAELLTQ